MTIITNTAPTTPSVPTFDVLYAKMLPHFRYYARCHVRRKNRRGDYEDVIQDLTGIALDMYTSLVRRGKEVFYSPLVQFAIKRYREGRRFTGSNTRDILSEQAQIIGRSNACQLSALEREPGTWDFGHYNRHHNPAEAVQWKLDYEAWIAMQTPRDQDIITDLSYGETTGDVARKYRVSAGLISQYRKRYRNSWNAYIVDKNEMA